MIIAFAAPPLLTTLFSATLPITVEQVELVQAGSGMIGVMTAMFVWMTFGRLEANQKREESLQERRDPVAEAVPALGTATGHAVGVAAARRPGRIVDQMARHDPGLSEVDLWSWLGALPAAALAADVEAVRTRLRPYVAMDAWQELTRQLRGADQVEVGPVVLLEAEHGHWDTLQLGVGLRVRHAEVWTPDAQVWTVRRSTAARSLPLADMLALGCPACGSPIQLAPPEWGCAACDRRIAEGQLHWQLRAVRGRAAGVRSPAWEALTAGGPHASMHIQLVGSDDRAAQLRSLAARCPGFDLAAVDARVREVARAAAADEPVEGLQPALDWERDRIAHLGLRRIMGPVEVVATDLLRAGRDGWYERLDVRVVLHGVRALVDESGRVVDGHPELPQHWAVVLRMAHPSGRPSDVALWRPWQLLAPQEYPG